MSRVKRCQMSNTLTVFILFVDISSHNNELLQAHIAYLWQMDHGVIFEKLAVNGVPNSLEVRYLKNPK